MPILILFLTSTITSALAQEASIPDPGLNAAIRQALQKPNGPLTEHDLLSLTNLTARGRNISSVAGLELARNLALLDLQFNTLTNFVLPGALTNLDLLDLGFNPLTQCSVPSGLTNLSTVIIEGSLLTDFRLPAGMRNLTSLFLVKNHLTNLVLSPDLIHLVQIDVGANELTSLTLPAGLINLSELFLAGNQLTTLTFPPELTKLTSVILDGNPLTTLVLSDSLAATNLAETVASLRSEGVSVFTYPPMIQLISPRTTGAGAFTFALLGPPGVYTLLDSVDLGVWNALGVATNSLGFVRLSIRRLFSLHRSFTACAPPRSHSPIGKSIHQSLLGRATFSRRHSFKAQRTDVTQIDNMKVLPLDDDRSALGLVEHQAFRMSNRNRGPIIDLQFKRREGLLLQCILDIYGFHALESCCMASTLSSLGEPQPVQTFAQSFFFSTGAPDGRMATASRPGSQDLPEIESADDFLLSQDTFIRQATFTGLLPTGTALSNVTEVIVEIYRVFSKDSTIPPDGRVPTRNNSPSDVAFGSTSLLAQCMRPTRKVSRLSIRVGPSNET